MWRLAGSSPSPDHWCVRRSNTELLHGPAARRLRRRRPPQNHFHVSLGIHLAARRVWPIGADDLCHPILSHVPFTRDGWLFELKHDGFRALARTGRSGVQLLSRSSRSMAEPFPEVVAALEHLPYGLVLDGELVVATTDGRSDFEELRRRNLLQRQRMIREAAVASPAVLIVFDLLEADGEDLRAWPLLERRRALHERCSGTPPAGNSARRDAWRSAVPCDRGRRLRGNRREARGRALQSRSTARVGENKEPRLPTARGGGVAGALNAYVYPNRCISNLRRTLFTGTNSCPFKSISAPLISILLPSGAHSPRIA
jgi:hypothetical protein